MKQEELTHKIIGAAYKVFNQLGFGFLESVYKKALIIELTKNNLKVEAEKPLKVYYDNQVVGDFVMRYSFLTPFTLFPMFTPWNSALRTPVQGIPLGPSALS